MSCIACMTFVCGCEGIELAHQPVAEAEMSRDETNSQLLDSAITLLQQHRGSLHELDPRTSS